MYIRTSQGKTEFSTCKSIKLIYNHDTLSIGQWVSNPSAELIAAEDWLDYIPPVPEPQPLEHPDEYQKVNALNKLVSTNVIALDDESALEVIALFPAWADNIGKVLHVGERYYYDESLWKVLLEHTSLSDWKPSVSPSLFVRVSIEEWPEWVRPQGATDAYSIGDKVTYNGLHYISTINGNTWSPEEYPLGWQLVND